MENFETKELVLTREKFKKSGKEYSNYVVLGEYRNRKGRARFVPFDAGGYAFLDMVFGDKDQLPLRISPFETKLDNGQVVSGYKYTVHDDDPTTGEVLVECQVKPFQRSDKDWVNLFLNN